MSLSKSNMIMPGGADQERLAKVIECSNQITYLLNTSSYDSEGMFYALCNELLCLMMAEEKQRPFMIAALKQIDWATLATSELEPVTVQ